MPEWGDVEPTYGMVFGPGTAGPAPAGPVFDPYAYDIPASPLDVATIDLIGGQSFIDIDIFKTSPDPADPKWGAYITPQEYLAPSVTAQPQPIPTPPPSGGGSFFDFLAPIKDIFTGIPDTPLFKIPGFVDETIKGVPDTPLLKLASGVGGVVDDTVSSLGGWGNIGAMLPIFFLMSLMNKD